MKAQCVGSLVWLLCACSWSSTTSVIPSVYATTGGTGSSTDVAPIDGGISGSACRLSSDCANLGATFCQKDSCDPNVIGQCTLIPGTRETGYCQPETNFICGCDGQTYEYPCLAHAREVNVASQGPCPLPEGGMPCSASSDCGSSSLYCKKDNCTADAGTCAGTPDFEVCFAMLDGGSAVCGCDHNTYSSSCEAASYGISVDLSGPCPALPSGPCTTQADCGDSSYVNLVYCAPNTCGAPAGRCTPVPAGCSNLYIPVCGCDGTTYPNECYAQAAKVGIAQTGSCP